MKKIFIIMIIILNSCIKNINRLNNKDKGKIEDLILAIINNNKDKIIDILNGSINVNDKDEFGNIALVKASEYGHKEILELLLSKGANINDKNGGFIIKGFTALMIASREGHEEIVELLLEKGADVNEKLEHGCTALMLASRYGHKEIVKILLEKGANVNNKGSSYIYYECTALMLASHNCYKEIVELLLKNGANIDDKNDLGETSLMITLGTKYEDIEVVKLLIKSGANIYEKDNKGRTSLMIESRNGHIKVLRLLLEKGANVNEKDDKGITALMLASQNGHLEIVKLLIEKGANINDKNIDGFTPLAFALSDDHIEVVRFLLEKVANVNEKDDKGITALMLASQNGYLEIVKLLIEKGANINDKDNDGFTPLVFALNDDHIEVARFLLEKGAKIIDISNNGFTLLMLASRKGKRGVVKLLLENGVNINDKYIDGRTALMLAAHEGHIKVVKTLIKRGANINEKKDKGYTALMLAAKNGFLEIIKLLLKEGANINEINTSGYTTLMQASFLGCLEVVKLLLEKGAKFNIKNTKGDTALKLALKKNHKEVSRILIENFCQIDEDIELNNLIENTIIYNIKNNKIETCFSIINNYKNIIDFNYKDSEGNTFLHYAAVSKDFRLFNLFLDKNVDINALNYRGETPLYFALSQSDFQEDFIWYLLNNKAVLKPSSHINDKALVDILLPYESLCNKLVYKPSISKLLGNNYATNKQILRNVIKTLKIKDNDFDQEKDMINFLRNILTSNTGNIIISDISIPEDDLEDVDLNIDVFKMIFNNFTIDDYWDEVKANLQYNINIFMGRLEDIKNAPPTSKPDNKSLAKDKAMYMTFKAKKQLHKLLGYISLTVERGKNNDKIIFAINQILSELVCRGGSLEAIDLAVNTFTGESNNELKHDLSILLLNLRKQLLKESARGRCYVRYFDPMEGRNIETKMEPENPHLLIHLCNSFSSELKLPIHVDEHHFNYIYNKITIMNEYNKMYTVDKIIEYMMAQIDPENNSALWNKVKDYIERNIFKGRPILQIEKFIYDDNYKMKKEAIIALLIHFNILR